MLGETRQKDQGRLAHLCDGPFWQDIKQGLALDGREPEALLLCKKLPSPQLHRPCVGKPALPGKNGFTGDFTEAFQQQGFVPKLWVAMDNKPWDEIQTRCTFDGTESAQTTKIPSRRLHLGTWRGASALPPGRAASRSMCVHPTPELFHPSQAGKNPENSTGPCELLDGPTGRPQVDEPVLRQDVWQLKQAEWLLEKSG